MSLLPIYKLQGNQPHSPFAGSTVTTRGVVTGISRRGFFIQDVDTTENPPHDAEGCSHAIFVFYRGKMPPIGTELELTGKVVDYVKGEPGIDKPVTQLHFESIELVSETSPLPKPIALSAELLIEQRHTLPQFLNSHEGMLFKIEAGAEFIQPSNPFGDYVIAPKNIDMEKYAPGSCRANHGGYTFTAQNMECWLPGYRTASISDAPIVDVGDTLKTDVVGPLYFRSSSYQMITSSGFDISKDSSARRSETIQKAAATVKDTNDSIRVMTVNCLNLDPTIEQKHLVQNATLDVDDDVGDMQFIRLAKDVIELGNCPEVIALQEIQDNDGAEITHIVDASETYLHFIQAITKLGGPQYSWADIPPKSHEDGGQPGGNIRNGFLYRADRVKLVEGSLLRLGETAACFEGSRKPLVATFERLGSETGKTQHLNVINVHLASKRRQHGIFALSSSGFDPREEVRVEQAEVIYQHMQQKHQADTDCYVTGDFNDLLGSATLSALLGDSNVNLVENLPPGDRYDYNHRGKLHVLMHGLVHKGLNEQRRAKYEILHGNELKGIRPGTMGDKASDHAYVIAAIKG